MLKKHTRPLLFTFYALRSGCLLLAMASLCSFAAASEAWPDGGQESPSLANVVDNVQPKMVKIFGSGGLAGLEAYQSGFLISAQGHVLTVWSYVLDSEELLTVVLDDGQRFSAKLVNRDPRLEIAILKIDAADLPHYDLSQAVEPGIGARVLAFTNLYGVATGNEPASVQHGYIAARAPLAARRSAFKTLYRGEVYIVDAMTNNPGAAGGALTDQAGRLVGLVGKELRNELDNTWLNYALPIGELTASVQDILAGRTPSRSDPNLDRRKPSTPHTLERLGITLVPDVLAKTPPFVDKITPGSLAQRAGIRPDDLILFVNDQVVNSCKELRDELSYVDRIDVLRLTVDRGQTLQTFEIQP